MTNFDPEVFNNDLSSPSLIQKLENADNTSMAFEIYNKFFIQTLNKHAPMKYLSKNECKLKQKPWLTAEILGAIKTKRKLFKTYKKARFDTGDYNEVFERY